MGRFLTLKNHEEDQWSALWRGFVSEYCATLIFIFLGTGSVVACQTALGESNIGVPSLVVISVAHGFAITIMIYSIGEVSGGHINPAVTWAVFITNRMSAIRAVTYWIAQILGAICGSAILAGLLPANLQFGMGCTGLNDRMTPFQGFGSEFVFTFIFIFVVFATAVSPFGGKLAPLQGGEYGPGKLTPLAVGLTILILCAVGIPMTGASMNPARSFGPAVVAGCWANHWIYWIGPILGSTAAAFIAQTIFLNQPQALLNIILNRPAPVPSEDSTR